MDVYNYYLLGNYIIVLQANDELQFVQNLVCFTYDSYRLFSSMLQEYHPDHPQHANISGLQFLSWKSLKHSCHWVSACYHEFYVHVMSKPLPGSCIGLGLYSFKILSQTLRLSSLPASQCPCLLYLKLIPSATEHHCSSSHGLHHHRYFPVLPGSPFPTTAATVPLQLPSQGHFITIMLPEMAES